MAFDGLGNILTAGDYVVYKSKTYYYRGLVLDVRNKIADILLFDSKEFILVKEENVLTEYFLIKSYSRALRMGIYKIFLNALNSSSFSKELDYLKDKIRITEEIKKFKLINKNNQIEVEKFLSILENHFNFDY